MQADRYQLERAPTTGGRESKGVAFGLEGNLFAPAVISAFTGIAVFLYMVTDHGLVVAAICGASLPLVTVGFIKFYLNRKPPHFIGDWFESRLRKSYLFPNNKRQSPLTILEDK